jgi:DNA excision repair protein ERCC-4
VGLPPGTVPEGVLAPGATPGTNPLAADSVVNVAAMELLRRLPGVTDANYRAIVRELGSLRALAEAPLERLAAVMSSQRGAKALFDFLHAPCPLAP